MLELKEVVATDAVKAYEADTALKTLKLDVKVATGTLLEFPTQTEPEGKFGNVTGPGFNITPCPPLPSFVTYPST